LIKGVLKKDKRPSFVGLRNEEGDRRKWEWEKHGCIRWDQKVKRCTPISLFTEEEVWQYIKENQLDYPKAYDMGWKRTGCLMCGFGTQFKRKRAELLQIKTIYPNIWKRYAPYFKTFWEREGWKELYA
jgi:3'-phosphoadenosine 5'-phosphosulfate sulfotransferase (PAPS reductase)/FAD synthetase